MTELPTQRQTSESPTVPQAGDRYHFAMRDTLGAPGDTVSSPRTQEPDEEPNIVRSVN